YCRRANLQFVRIGLWGTQRSLVVAALIHHRRARPSRRDFAAEVKRPCIPSQAPAGGGDFADAGVLGWGGAYESWVSRCGVKNAWAGCIRTVKDRRENCISGVRLQESAAYCDGHKKAVVRGLRLCRPHRQKE